MSDLNLPPDEQADHSGPVADPDSFGGDTAGASPVDDGDREPVDPATVPPAD